MTGLFANYNNNAGDDWTAISPSQFWWVKGTSQSAFSNRKYLLHWSNRKVRKGPVQTLHAGEVATATAKNADGTDREVKSHEWTPQDELTALREVDPLTAKMRQRLFEKMVAEHVIERKKGDPAPTSELARAEEDIMPFEGERPSRLRIEQQLMFRQRWKVFSEAQRKEVLAGEVVSGSAVGFDEQCRSCVKGEMTADGSQTVCDEMGIVEPKPKGIIWGTAEKKKVCLDGCLGWLTLSQTPVICGCWIDCNLDVGEAEYKKNVLDNYLKRRRVLLTPSTGKKREKCLEANQSPARIFRGDKPGARRRWEMFYAPNFALTFWWRPDMEPGSGSYATPGVKTLLYKGMNKTETGDDGMEKKPPVLIAVDASGADKFLKITVAGAQSSVPADKCPSLAEDKFTFVAVTKRGTTVSVWCGAEGGDKSEKVWTFDLGEAGYFTSLDQVIAVGGINEPKERVPGGWMGKLNYYGVSVWDPTNEVQLWDYVIPNRFAVGPPNDCP